MKETKNVPQLRFSGFDDEWEEKNLGDIVTEFKNPVELPHNGYTRLGIRSHAKGTFHESVAPGHELEAAQMSEVKADNLIMSITFAWEHAVAITDKNDEGKLVSQRFPQFRFNKGQVPKFYKYVIADEKFRHHLWLSSPGGAGRNRVLNIKESMEYKTSVPTTNVEQQKIGAFLSHIDSLIQTKTKKLESLKAVKKSLLQKCFPKAGQKVPEMRFAGFSGDWEEKKLGDVITVNSGKDYKHLDEGNIPVYGTGGYMLSVNAKLSDIDAVGIGRKGTIDNPLYLKAPFWTVDTLFFMTANNGFDLKFIYNLSQNIDWKSMDESTSIPSLSKNNIVDVEVLIPPSLEEQQKIGQFFSKYDSLISAQQKEIDKLKNIKKSLLQKMFV